MIMKFTKYLYWFSHVLKAPNAIKTMTKKCPLLSSIYCRNQALIVLMLLNHLQEAWEGTLNKPHSSYFLSYDSRTRAVRDFQSPPSIKWDPLNERQRLKILHHYHAELLKRKHYLDKVSNSTSLSCLDASVPYQKILAKEISNSCLQKDKISIWVIFNCL